MNFDRIHPMKVLDPLDQGFKIHNCFIPHPLDSANVPWAIIETDGNLMKGQHYSYLSPRKIFNSIICDISVVYGQPASFCIINGIVAGVTNWEKILIEDQYYAINEKAGVFDASQLRYISIQGPDAINVLNLLTPRDIGKLSIGTAMFSYLTTPFGTIDDECIILRTDDDEFLMTGGKIKQPSFMRNAIAHYPRVNVTKADIVSFNIKGPKKIEAMQKLIHSNDQHKVQALKNFQACYVKTKDGSKVWVIKTIISIEMWGAFSVIQSVWQYMLEQSDIFTPCGWTILNVFRLENSEIKFGLYPLDLHNRTTVWELEHGWMVEKKKEQDIFIGKQALERLKDKPQFRWCGLKANDPSIDPPPVGSPVFANNETFVGYVTSCAFSIRHNCSLAFAHISMACSTGDVLKINDYGTWTLHNLPFNTK